MEIKKEDLHPDLHPMHDILINHGYKLRKHESHENANAIYSKSDPDRKKKSFTAAIGRTKDGVNCELGHSNNISTHGPHYEDGRPHSEAHILHKDLDQALQQQTKDFSRKKSIKESVMDKTSISNFITHLQSGKQLEAQESFNMIMGVKISDALENMKRDVAGSLFAEQTIDEAVKLFHPGHEATVHSIDKYGMTGRDQHPPTDGSIHGHKVRIDGYSETSHSHGIEHVGYSDSSDNPGGRIQFIKGTMKSGPHKGKQFEFAHYELKH